MNHYLFLIKFVNLCLYNKEILFIHRGGKDLDAWAVFTFIGTVSFSLQGGMIAMEKNYDLFGVYLFGILTAFGGGAIRNTLIDTSDYEL